MNEHFTQADSGVVAYPPVPLGPPRRVEYPYQTTLAVPGLVMPFTPPGAPPGLVLLATCKFFLMRGLSC
jgi:hypothetical protein